MILTDISQQWFDKASPQTEVRMPPRLGFYWQLKKKFRTPTLPSFLPRLLFLCSRQEAGAGWSTQDWEWIIQIVKCTAISSRSQHQCPGQGRAGATTRANRHLLCPDRDLLITKLNPPIQNPQNPISVGNSDLAEKQNQTEYNLSNLHDLGRRKLLMWKICHAQLQLQL